MLSTASLLPKSQESTFSLFTTTSSTNFASYHSEFQQLLDRVFPKILKPVIALLRTRGISLIIYLDDLLIAAGTWDIHRLSEPYKTNNFSSGVPGFSNQLRNVRNNPFPKTRIFGLHNRFNLYDSCPASRENSVDKIIRLKASKNKRYHLNKTSLKIHRPLHIGKICCLPSTSGSLRNSVLKGRRYSPSLYNPKVHLSPEALTDLKWWADHLQYHSKTPTHINNPNLNITLDASDLGWGAWCGEKSVQGLWSQEEIFWHVNPKELQAAYLALKIFSPSQINQLFHIQLQIDNQAAVSYINHLGGTHSKLLCKLSLDLWNWSLSRQIHISARYIPGIFNKHADHTSRRLKLTTEWKLNPILFQRSLRDTTDRFVCDKSQHSAQKFVSWIPCPQSTAIDAFSVQWSDPLSYAFPPFSLIMRCVQRIKNQKKKIVLVTPVWRSRPWYPLLFSPLYDRPLLLPNSETTPLPPSNQKPFKPQLNINKLTLAVWPLSGNASLNAKFLRECPKSYSPHGAQEQNLSVSPVEESGMAGVWNGKSIQFLVTKILCWNF